MKTEKQEWLMTEKERKERDRLHTLWATQRITKAQIERLETLDLKYKREGEILCAIH